MYDSKYIDRDDDEVEVVNVSLLYGLDCTPALKEALKDRALTRFLRWEEDLLGCAIYGFANEKDTESFVVNAVASLPQEEKDRLKKLTTLSIELVKALSAFPGNMWVDSDHKQLAKVFKEWHRKEIRNDPMYFPINN